MFAWTKNCNCFIVWLAFQLTGVNHSRIFSYFFFFLWFHGEYPWLLTKWRLPKMKECIDKVYVALQLWTWEEEMRHEKFNRTRERSKRKGRTLGSLGKQGCGRDMVGVLKYSGCCHGEERLFYVSLLGQNKDRLMVCVVWEIRFI